MDINAKKTVVKIVSFSPVWNYLKWSSLIVGINVMSLALWHLNNTMNKAYVRINVENFSNVVINVLISAHNAKEVDSFMEFVIKIVIEY